MFPETLAATGTRVALRLSLLEGRKVTAPLNMSDKCHSQEGKHRNA